MIDEHPFSMLSCEEQHRLCVKALEHLALKNVNIEVEISKFRLVYLNEMQREDHVGMRCSTIPFIFLFTPGDPENKVKIVLEKNPFLDEHRELVVEIIKLATFRYGELLIYVNFLREVNPILYIMSVVDRRRLRISTVKDVAMTGAYFSPVVRTSWQICNSVSFFPSKVIN